MDFKDYFELTQLYADYASAVDPADWDAWPEFFIDDCVYRLQPRENHERGFPLATLAFDSKGMLKDRVYGIRETLFHDPYYQRTSSARRSCAKPPTGASTARPTTRSFAPSCRSCRRSSTSAATIDEVVRTPLGLKFASRSWCTTAR
jgi:salicylate 5-hydroxylase small subunit